MVSTMQGVHETQGTEDMSKRVSNKRRNRSRRPARSVVSKQGPAKRLPHYEGGTVVRFREPKQVVQQG